MDLDVDSSSHIWLLHHLFLGPLNDDLDEWVQTWNHHTMQLKNGYNQSPVEMFMFGILERKAPGIAERIVAEEDEVADVESFGIDWEGLDHHQAHDLPSLKRNGMPEKMNEVCCDPPDCPLRRDEVVSMDQILAAEFDLTTHSMETRKLIWQRALEIACSFD